MTINYNVKPYYDDFDPTKNFHRILFKPGYAVQARELTQSQTILQDQVTKFADNIFKQNSPVTGGQITTNLNCYYVKLQPTYSGASIDVTQFDGTLVQNSTGTVIARVVAVAAATGTAEAGDPPTLILSYKSGNQFTDNDVIYDVNSNLAVQALSLNSTGKSSVASIAQGVFYILGNFVQISPMTIILDKYDNAPTKRIGLTITETTYDYVNDSSLLDPAVGASNYQAPGADRYVIKLTLDTKSIQFGDDQNFVELLRIESGTISKMVNGSVYNVIDDYFAKRDYETNGDYVVNDFKLTPKANTSNSAIYTMGVGKGLAYVRGYRLENQTDVNIISNRARTTASQNNTPVFVDYGSYFYVDTVRGGASGSFFDVTTAQTIDLHCVTTSNIITTNTSTYNSTLVGTGYIRNLVYQFNTTDADSNTYVYKAYVNDIQNASLSANAITATANTITLPGTYSTANGAYVGVNLSITKGTNLGDFRTITAYNGTTRVATVNQNWTVTPDSSSVFTMNFDIKDIETVVYSDTTSYPATIKGYANINSTGRVGGISSGNTLLENLDGPELLFNVGTPFVASMKNSSYNTQQLTRNVSFTVSGSAASATLNYTGDYAGVVKHLGTPGTSLSSDVIKQNFVIVVTNKGSSSLNVGEIIPWTTKSGTITLSSDGATATLSIPTSTVSAGFTATVLEKVYVSNADDTNHILKYKNLITANTSVVKTNGTQVATYTFVDDAALSSTGQVYIQAAGVVSPGSKQSLYLADVKRIVKIIDTKSSGTSPTVSMITNPSYDVTNNFIFNNGQRDSYYDHASITLKPGATKPAGNLLIFVDYYQHTGGDGYFSLNSYLNSLKPEAYQTIPTYTSKHAMIYKLSDCVDFRPARVNASATFAFKYNTTGDNRQGVFIPTDLSTFTTDYSYYLGRKDKLILTKDRSFQIVQGTPSLVPLLPTEPDGSLVIANLSLNPYTGYLPTETPVGTAADLSIEKVNHKRYTMQDIASLEERINQIEYYSSLSVLEQKTQSLQIPDAYGLNRFKNGILVDDFSGYSTADTSNSDYFATINRRDKQMTASQQVTNFPLKAVAQVYNMGKLSSDTQSSLGYAINTDGYVNYFSLPYTSANVASQKFASRTINLNPFSVSTQEGTLSISPNVDNWVDTNVSPAILVTDPSLTIYAANSSVNAMVIGDWKTITGTTTATTTRSGNIETTTSYTPITQVQQNLVGNYSKVNNTYALNDDYITDVTILPFIRSQNITIKAKNLLFFTTLNTHFDNIDISNYVRKVNTIELTGVSGTFNENDVIGYYSSGSFHPTATVLGVYAYPGTTNVRLYVVGDISFSAYTTNGTIQNGFFNTTGTYVSTTANGTLSSTEHSSGKITTGGTNVTSIVLSPLASSVTGHYVGKTIYMTNGTGIGRSATISAYNGSTKTATLSSSLTCAAGDLYSIGTFVSDEVGTFYGVFQIPPNTFHTGERVLRIDNAISDNPGTQTTIATGSFYSDGLQTKSQKLEFGASPAGAKNTFTQTNYANTVQISTSTVDLSPRGFGGGGGWFGGWGGPGGGDPVAQTFIISKDNYPNGLFLNSAKFFFNSKPTSDNSPVELSIVGTLNGYPNGQTLDHSIVSLTPDKVNISTTPQYLDSTTSTTFTFNAPVYIQPGVMYAFILKSNSKEYTVWSASNGDTAVASSVKNLPSDPLPSNITKITAAPYVGGVFISQNSQTWTADQNQSLMFVLDRCVFNTSATPSIQFVVPKKLPQRTLVDQSVDYYLNANNISSTIDTVSSSDVFVDAFNVTTTDFMPTGAKNYYTYNATLVGGNSAGLKNIIPGKYGTSTQDDIYLNDGLGERVLSVNTSTSFSLYSQMSTVDDAISPIISDAGLSVYAIKWNINNCELSNSLITLTNGGSSYNAQATSVTVSAPTGSSGSQAYAAANIVGGIVQSVYLTNAGSGYVTTPTITITDSSLAGSGATATINGETSKNGGPGLAKYVTKKVILNAGFDSGDLNVYLTAYRPVNTDINVYYKILNRSDTQSFDDSSWQLMTKINNSASVYSSTRDELFEYSFAPGTNNVSQGYVSYNSLTGQTYTTFSQFAIKVVLTSTDHTYTPYAVDLRAVALPSNVNTSV